MHRAAHALGMRTTATMMFGCGEEYRHRVNHFERCANSGRYRRIHGVHSLVFRAGQYSARQENSGSDRLRLPEDAGHQPPLSGQHRPHPIELAYAGNQDLPDRFAVRCRRRGQHLDRRKCGLRRGRAQPHERSRVAPHHLRRRLHSRATRHALPFLRFEVKAPGGLVQAILTRLAA